MVGCFLTGNTIECNGRFVHIEAYHYACSTEETFPGDSGTSTSRIEKIRENKKNCFMCIGSGYQIMNKL